MINLLTFRRLLALGLVATTGLTVLTGCKNGIGKTEGPTLIEVSEPDTEVDNTDQVIVNFNSERPTKPSYTRYVDLLHTKLEVSFDWAKRHLLGVATLSIKPHFYATDSVVLDAKGFKINKVELLPKGNGAATGLSFSYNDLKLTVYLGKTYARTDTFRLRIDYVARPDELPLGGSTAIGSDKGLYFINPDGTEKYKPTQLWTQGETEASSCWFPTIDSPNERCTQEIYIKTDPKLQTLSNGKLVSSTLVGDQKVDYWRQDKPHAPYLFMMAVGPFAKVEDTPWRGKPVDYYVDPEYAPYAKMVFGNTPQMLTFYSDYFGVEYMWDKYAQVVCHDYVSGAMENTGAVIFYDALHHDHRAHLDETNEDIIAHELSHHWFGDYVTCESWGQLPLNESFATYSEYLWIEHKYGRQEADEHLQADYRSYLREAEEQQYSLIRYHYENREDMFDAHSYQKGGQVLHMLRHVVGDDAFRASLQLYLTRNALSDVEIDELRLAFEDVTGQDLKWFFDQWFHKPGHPLITASYKYDDFRKKLTVTLQQKPSEPNQGPRPYRLPTEVEIVTAAGAKRYPIVLEKGTQEFNFFIDGEPLNFSLDPDGILLAEIAEKGKLLKHYAHQLADTKAGYRQKARAVEALEGFFSNLNPSRLEQDFALIKPSIDHLLKDAYWANRKHGIRALKLLEKYAPEQVEAFADKLTDMAKTDPKANVRLNALRFLCEIIYQGDNVTPKPLLLHALNDSSYAVVAAALNLHYNAHGPGATVDLARKAMNLNSREVRLEVARILTSAFTDDAFAYTVDNIDWMGDGGELYDLIEVLGYYVDELLAPDRGPGIEVLKKVAEKHAIWYIRLSAARALVSLEDEHDDVHNFLVKLRKTETHPELKDIYSYELPEN